jgi:glycosyltransferase involved in cell wall biosynthesis
MRDLFKVERQGLRDGIRLANPDILHAHWTYEFALACLETGLPTLVTSHDNAVQVLRFSRDLYRLGRLCLQIRVIKRAPFLTAVSPYLAKALRWIAKRDIPVIPNAVDFPKDNENTIKWEPAPFKIATVLNGWGRLKNPKGAIEAFNLLRYQLPDAEMFMYGVDYEEGGLASRWASSQGLSENIHFCGFISPGDLQNNLRKMSVLLHPALEEACPLALLESMALGVPVVAGAHAGGVPWVLDNGKAGFLTDAREPKNIAKTLLICVEETTTREEKQRNARRRVLSLFSPNSVAEQYEQMYEEVLASHSGLRELKIRDHSTREEPFVSYSRAHEENSLSSRES